MGKRNGLLVAGLVLVLAVVSFTGCSPGTATIGGIEGINISNQQEGIWVSGRGEVAAAPDIVNLRLGVEATETSVAQAHTEAAEAMNEVMTALTDNGVVEKDIQTQYFSIHQVTRWDRDKEQEVVIGYRVSNIVTAKIRDIDKIGTIIDDVAKAGGDLTRIYSIDFSIDDPSNLYEEAREEAIADARAKAEQLARLAGVKLGKATYISEGSQVRPVYPQVMMEIEVMEAAPVTTPISPGETEISLVVQVVYAILQQ